MYLKCNLSTAATLVVLKKTLDCRILFPVRVDNARHSQILTFEQCRYFQVKVTISRPNESSSHVGLTALLHIGPLCTGFIHNEEDFFLLELDYRIVAKRSIILVSES